MALDDTKAAAQLQEAGGPSESGAPRSPAWNSCSGSAHRPVNTMTASAESAEKSSDRGCQTAGTTTPGSSPSPGHHRFPAGESRTGHQQNTRLTWLVDLDTVKVEVDVPERYLSQLRVGQPLSFGWRPFPRTPFRGIYFISPQLDPGNRTALVKARNSERRRNCGGMFANLDLGLQLRDSALVIPGRRSSITGTPPSSSL